MLINQDRRQFQFSRCGLNGESQAWSMLQLEYWIVSELLRQNTRCRAARRSYHHTI